MTGELPEGMKPWDGGDAAPTDYDGGKVLSRRQGLQYPDRLNGNRWGRERTHQFFHEDEESCDIIAYTPMNPHQKPQEDVVALIRDLRKAARRNASKHAETREWRAADALERFVENAKSYEAGRRDMREAADEPLDYIDLFRIIRRAGRKDAAKAKAVHDAYTAAIRFAATEPLGGEG